MLRQNPANLSKRQLAELLFDEFYDISCKKKIIKKSPINRGFQGDVAISDSKKRFSGSFTRESKLLQSRTHPSTEDQWEGYVAQAPDDLFAGHQQRRDQPVARGHSDHDTASPTEESCDVTGASCSAEGPTEEVIRETANKIATIGDELDDQYKRRLIEAGESLTVSLNQRRSQVSYEAFSSLVSNVIPQDGTSAAFLFAMHLTAYVGHLIVPHMRRYITDQFADEAEAVIQQQLHHQ